MEVCNDMESNPYSWWTHSGYLTLASLIDSFTDFKGALEKHWRTDM